MSLAECYESLKYLYDEQYLSAYTHYWRYHCYDHTARGHPVNSICLYSSTRVLYNEGSIDDSRRDSYTDTYTHICLDMKFTSLRIKQTCLPWQELDSLTRTKLIANSRKSI